MFEPVSSRANEENYLNFAVNANGVLHAEYGSRRMYRSYFTEAERVGFECHAEVHENDWTAELKVPVKNFGKDLRTAEFRRRKLFYMQFL